MDEMTLLRDLRLSIPAADVTRAAEEAFISCITAEAANPPTAMHPATAARIAAPPRRRYSFIPGHDWRRPAVRDFAWRLGVIGGGHRWRLAVAVAVSVALAVGLIAGVRRSPPSRPASGSIPRP